MTQKLADIAYAMVAPGKGILAADESSGTIKKRFDKIGLASSEESRRDYREMLFRSTEAMKNSISGVILYDETIRQNPRHSRWQVIEASLAAGYQGRRAQALPFCRRVITEV
jgi:fructose-bisphosphate aldolase class I